MGRVEDYWDKLRKLREQDWQDVVNKISATTFTQYDIELARSLGIDLTPSNGGQNGCHN